MIYKFILTINIDLIMYCQIIIFKRYLYIDIIDFKKLVNIR